MKNLILILLLISTAAFAQNYKVEKVSGNVKALINGDDKWIDLKSGSELGMNSVISTEKNSSVKITSKDIIFNLKESSAISVSNIKKMSTDELLLTLAMEEILNAPRNKNKVKSDNTAVYGTQEGTVPVEMQSTDFGVKRLNGAIQLAENGMKESAIATSKEIYRKYPETKKLSFYRIFFAELLNEKGLYEEALDEYNDIKTLKLSNEEKNKVESAIDEINKKLINK